MYIKGDSERTMSFPSNSETCRPGAASGEKKLSIPPFVGEAGKVRGAVVCDMCAKPRAIYANLQITPGDTTKMKQSLEAIGFTCGSPIFQVDAENAIDAMCNKVWTRCMIMRLSS